MADMASELEAAAFRLRRAGEEGLARELTAAMRRGVQPVPGLIRSGLKPHLPDRYAEELDADLAIGTSARNSGGDATASVYADTRLGTGRSGVRAGGKARKLRYLDSGRLTHPVFGNREVWRTQLVEPGWFTGPAEEAVPRVREELERALRDVAAKAEGK